MGTTGGDDPGWADEGPGDALPPVGGLLAAGLVDWPVPPADADGPWPLPHADTAASGASSAAVTAAARTQPPAGSRRRAFLADHLSIADLASWPVARRCQSIATGG
jgi:hypothetical protein